MRLADRWHRAARVALPVAALCVLAQLAMPLVAAAATQQREQVLPQSSGDDIRAVAQVDEHFSQVLNFRPGLLLTMRFDEQRRVWTVSAREAGGTADLATLVVDDRTREVRRRHFLPFDRFPPRLTEREVLRAAARDRRTRAALAEHGGERLRPSATFVDGVRWEVRYRPAGGGKPVVQVEVEDATGDVEGVWTGHAIAWEMARGNRYAFGGDINLWYVWWPLFVVFALVMVQPGALRSLRTLDVVAVLAFGVSHEFFNRGMIEWSVPLAVPPLLWLLARMSWICVRGQRSGAAAVETGSSAPAPALAPAAARGSGRLRRTLRLLRPWPPLWLLLVILVFACGLRYGTTVWGGNVIDVGYAGVAGASRIIEDELPYGNMPDDNRHGDTYGPLNYLVYVPAVAAFGGPEEQDWEEGLPAAVAVAIASDVLAMLTLAFVGWRWISRRGAALLATGWASCPWTAFALANGVNDLLVGALLLLAFAALPRAWLRGVLVGAAAAVKFVPLVALAPLMHAGVRRRRRQALLVVAGAGSVVVACALWLASYDDGVARFVDATWGFQYGRSSPFSPWGLYDWRLAQQIAQVLLAVVLAAAVFVPRQRDFRQVAAGMAAAVIGVQLVLQHWFYLYIPWFVGLVLIVLVAARETNTAPLPRRPREQLQEPVSGQPSLYSTP